MAVAYYKKVCLPTSTAFIVYNSKDQIVQTIMGGTSKELAEAQKLANALRAAGL
jgi:hypothetical protein